MYRCVPSFHIICLVLPLVHFRYLFIKVDFKGCYQCSKWKCVWPGIGAASLTSLDKKSLLTWINQNQHVCYRAPDDNLPAGATGKDRGGPFVTFIGWLLSHFVSLVSLVIVLSLVSMIQGLPMFSLMFHGSVNGSKTLFCISSERNHNEKLHVLNSIVTVQKIVFLLHGLLFLHYQSHSSIFSLWCFVRLTLQHQFHQTPQRRKR